jgi:hypothetical protein
MKKYIDKELAEQIKDQVKLLDVIEGFVNLKKKSANVYVGECPLCHAKSALNVNTQKKMFKCFNCEWGGNNSVKFLQESQNMSYNEALNYLADKTNTVVPDRPHAVKVKTEAKDTSFKNRQLEASGLTKKDVKAWEYLPDNKQVEIDVFEAATVSKSNQIVKGDDMVIHYLDLDGRRIKYQVKNERTEREFYRVRWQFPESHLDRAGKPKKYQSPVGSSITLYIPETVRKIYRENHQTKRLFFTEGEKKAEKMCKHGMPAFGMPGINALVGKEKSFPESVVRFIEMCGVKEVFFVLDSDFRDLPAKISPEKDVTERSRMFFYAVKNFRDWFQTLVNRGIYLEIYMIGGKGEAKGIDDLLVGNISGCGEMFFADTFHKAIDREVNSAIEDNPQACEWFELHKISTISDLKLRDVWNLNDKKQFCDYHFDRLKEMAEFTYGRNKWRYRDDEIELAQPLMDDEKFFSENFHVKRDGSTVRELKFDYVNMKKFFRNRGFFRIHNDDRPNELIKVENNIIRVLKDHTEARDYAMELAEEVFDKEVQNMLIQGSGQYFGPEKIGQIAFFEPNFFPPDKNSEYLFFKEKYWRVSADGVEEKSLGELNGHVWAEQLKQYDAKRLDRLVKVERERRTIGDVPVYNVEFSETGKQCDFADFLWITSFHKWAEYNDDSRKPNGARIKEEDLNDVSVHFVSKMTAIGYLLHKYRDKNCEKAVIGMDAKISEVGEAFGRTGKSLLGFAISYAKNQVYIDGKRPDMEHDRFIWQEVNRKTENIFIDDVRVNFDFDLLYTIIVGMMTIEGKGAIKYTLKGNDVPKIYLTTNHMLNGSTTSYTDRQFKLAFSDFFDDDFKPFEYFGRSFFTEWDETQWNLFYNFMAECLELYFVAQKNGWGINHSGLIAAPCDSLERRQARQEMGERFFQWISDYLGVTEENHEQDGEKLNFRLVRSDMQNNFLEKNPREKNYYTPNKFWKKLACFCRYYGYRLNPAQTVDPAKPGHDKTSGVEYVTIANSHFDLEK